MGKIHKKRIFMKEKSIIQQNLKKIIGVIVVSVFAIITIYTVFRGSGISLNELMASLKEASWEGILLASVSMLGFIYFEGEALRVLVRHMGYPAKRSHGFVYSAADVYFSAITPVSYTHLDVYKRQQEYSFISRVCGNSTKQSNIKEDKIPFAPNI